MTVLTETRPSAPPVPQMPAIVEARGVVKTYDTGTVQVHALREVTFTVRRGEMVAIMGPSGSGKSSLLTIAGSLEEPTDGEVLVAGESLSDMSRKDKARLRRRSIGFVFQDFRLLPKKNVFDNVAMPLLVQGASGSETRRKGSGIPAH